MAPSSAASTNREAVKRAALSLLAYGEGLATAVGSKFGQEGSLERRNSTGTLGLSQRPLKPGLDQLEETSLPLLETACQMGPVNADGVGTPELKVEPVSTS